MVNVDEALATLDRQVRPVQPASLTLEAAQGCILAQPVAMDVDAPPFHRAQLDGYAVRSADCPAGAELEVIGQADAGGAGDPIVCQGKCVGINTGARVPSGADAVLMVEYSQPVATPEPTTGRRFVRALRAVTPGYGIQHRASDAAAGDTVLQPGTRLGPAQLAVCAAAGLDRISVRQLRAALLTTGDELEPPRHGHIPGPGKIRNSNHPMLAALLHQSNATLLDLGTCGDTAAEICPRLERGLADADLLVVSGGMSMGTRDLIPPLLQELGVTFHIEKVRMKPGKPFLFGTRDSAGTRHYVAGLPGNPVSAYVTFLRFVQHAIALMTGASDTTHLFTATTATPLPPNGDREFYQPCTLRPAPAPATGLLADPLPWKGSADLFTLARANGLLIRPANSPALDVGCTIQVLSIGGA